MGEGGTLSLHHKKRRLGLPNLIFGKCYFQTYENEKSLLLYVKRHYTKISGNVEKLAVGTSRNVYKNFTNAC